MPGVDTRVDVLCELAELTTLQAEGFDDSESHTRQACLERARGHAFEAAELAGHTADSHWEVKVLLRVTNRTSSEITGPAFSPDGTRLYFNSQRGGRNGSGTGITYEVTLPSA